MVLFPPAKINIGLRVIRKRDDGYHEIETVMIPIPLSDVLEAVVDEKLPQGTVRYERTGLKIAGDPKADLCMKAVELIREKHWIPGLRVHLHKVIPTGAGLGGGSSDGAHMLLLLDRLLGLGLERKVLHDLASRLGSDPPFFLEPRPQLAKGRGEILQPVELDLTKKWLMLVNPGIHVATAEVYRAMRPTGAPADLMRRIALPIDQWQEDVVNDMEGFVLTAYPEVRIAKEKIKAAGAVYAAMSGSGSTVYGIFCGGRPEALEWPVDHQQWILPLGPFT